MKKVMSIDEKCGDGVETLGNSGDAESSDAYSEGNDLEHVVNDNVTDFQSAGFQGDGEFSLDESVNTTVTDHMSAVLEDGYMAAEFCSRGDDHGTGLDEAVADDSPCVIPGEICNDLKKREILEMANSLKLF